MAKKTHSIPVLLIAVLAAVGALISFAGGLFSSCALIGKKIVCTEEVIGIVYEVSKDLEVSDDPAAVKFLESSGNKPKMHLRVSTDGVFTRKNLYATSKEHEVPGSQLTIHYSAKNPDNYYIYNWWSLFLPPIIFTLITGIISALLLQFLINDRRARNSEAEIDSQETQADPIPQDDRIYFDSPYASFIYCESDESYYEAEIDWPYNPINDEVKLTMCFDSDTPDMDSPNECYMRAAKLLEDKQRTDHEVKKLVTDFFMARPELLTEGATAESTMEGLSLTSISVHKNGETELGFYSSLTICADNIMVIYKPDGKKSISYRTDQEYTEEV